jgi:hypothetical protein
MSNGFWSKNILLNEKITAKGAKLQRDLERAMAFGQKTFGRQTQLLVKKQK